MADVDLSIKIPDEYVTKVLDAFTLITTEFSEISIDIHSHLGALGPQFSGAWGPFSIAPKNELESNKQFGERVFRELGKAILDLVDFMEDTEREKVEYAAIDIIPASSDVPEDILV